MWVRSKGDCQATSSPPAIFFPWSIKKRLRRTRSRVLSAEKVKELEALNFEVVQRRDQVPLNRLLSQAGSELSGWSACTHPPDPLFEPQLELSKRKGLVFLKAVRAVLSPSGSLRGPLGLGNLLCVCTCPNPSPAIGVREGEGHELHSPPATCHRYPFAGSTSGRRRSGHARTWRSRRSHLELSKGYNCKDLELKARQ
ncbi:hypothetical protein VNO77_19870 [Canavalia gladiata]|uniref:Uncharacterized protein n=1 Tax=Canavalia gladiata TaxID=3824 RepID=A0AAN9QIV8_CANGL